MMLLDLYKTGNNVNIPIKFISSDGTRLGLFCSNQRQAYSKNLLTESQINLLEEIGFKWSLR